jgi:hypothetical protein
MSKNLQYVTDERGERTAVILPIEEYEGLLEDSWMPRSAGRETHKLDRQTLARVAQVIDGLSDNPRPTRCLRVKT